MTANNTGGAGLGLGNIDRIAPCSERHFIADMFGLVTGMRIMASRTGSPFFTIDVEIVQVITTIPEVGQCLGGLSFRDLLIMTAEAKIIIFRGVGTVEVHRVKTRQQLGVLGTMYIVTGGAIPGLNRAVPILAGSHHLAKVTMTGEAELFHRVLKQGCIVGGMRPVAGYAFTLIHRGMLD